MFPSCSRTPRGSGLRKARSSNPFPCFRHWVRSHPRCLWPFSRRKPQVTQGGPSEGQVHHAINKGQCKP
uniref:Uncharacterized protein n=1 Tax=Rhinolophus ferrumequinum TaxID=59479 RepID=A0A671G157_RHIFE